MTGAGVDRLVDISLRTVAGLAALGYCVEEWEMWQQGQCVTYAHALIRLHPPLQLGVLGKIEDEGWRESHQFAHDDQYAYDSAGRHPLPYLGVHEDNDYAVLGQGLDWYDGPDERLIERAQAHALRNGIIEGRYGQSQVCGL